MMSEIYMTQLDPYGGHNFLFNLQVFWFLYFVESFWIINIANLDV